MWGIFFVLPHGQRLIFGSLHDLSFSRTLVVDATKVKDAVDNHPMKLFIIRLAELVGISEDRVE